MRLHELVQTALRCPVGSWWGQCRDIHTFTSQFFFDGQQQFIIEHRIHHRQVVHRVMDLCTSAFLLPHRVPPPAPPPSSHASKLRSRSPRRSVPYVQIQRLLHLVGVREKGSDASLGWVAVSSWAGQRHCANDHATLAQFFSDDWPQVLCPHLLHQFFVIHCVMLLRATKLTSVRDDLPANL